MSSEKDSNDSKIPFTGGPTSYDTPFSFTPEQVEKNGDTIGYIRIVRFENGIAVEVVGKHDVLVDTVARCINNDNNLAPILKQGLQLYDVRQNPVGRMFMDEILGFKSGKTFATQGDGKISEYEEDQFSGDGSPVAGDDCECPACTLRRKMGIPLYDAKPVDPDNIN